MFPAPTPAAFPPSGSGSVWVCDGVGAPTDVVVLERGTDDGRGGRAPAPHRHRPRREQARRARPGGLAVQPAGVQHLLAGGRTHRRRPVQPDHHRGGRGVRPLGADREAARQADQRRLDHRARPRRGGRARDAPGHRDGLERIGRVSSQVGALVESFEGKVVDVGSDQADGDAGRHPAPSTSSRTSSGPSASPSSSGRAWWPCLSCRPVPPPPRPATGTRHPHDPRHHITRRHRHDPVARRHGGSPGRGRLRWPSCTTSPTPTRA